MHNKEWYQLTDTHNLDSPALLVFPERVKKNIATALAMVDGDAARLQPHVKTCKSAEAIGLMLQAGLTLVTVKLVFIVLIVWTTGAVATHALARAALHDGLHPLLTGPDGTGVRLGTPGNPPDSSRVLTATIEGGLLPGRYAVSWQVAGLDGCMFDADALAAAELFLAQIAQLGGAEKVRLRDLS